MTDNGLGGVLRRRRVLLKNVCFLAVSVVALGYLGSDYADVGDWFGVHDYYTVNVELPQTGGLYPNADVTYRGVSVGRVGSISLTDTGVQARLHIRKSAPRIPAQLKADVADLSAVGEEYLDLRPSTDQGPYLAGGSVIPASATSVPAPVTDTLADVDALTQSVPLQSLRTVVDELGNAFAGQGQNLQQLLDSASQFTQAASKSLPATKQLIDDGTTVLGTQAQEADAIRSFAASTDQLAAQLKSSDGDLRRLIAVAPGAADQIDQLVQQVGPNLGVVLGNLLTTADVAQTRRDGIQELLVRLPEAVHDGSSAINAAGGDFGMVVSFFDPLPCTEGYGGTAHQPGTDTGAGAWNESAGCTAPTSTGKDIRGSQNAPQGDGQ